MELVQKDIERFAEQSASQELRNTLTQGPASVLQLEDIAEVWNAHQHFANEEGGRWRKFDPSVPYVAHPLWCSMSILVEPNLPSELRHIGSQVLLRHDQLEDTTLAIAESVSSTVKAYVAEMTFPGGSAEERARIWEKSKEVQLFKLYDRVSNMLDSTWMGDGQRATHFRYLDKLNQVVRRHYPQLQISAIADTLIAQYYTGGLDPEQEIRFSVGNLAPRIRCGEETFAIGILNRKQFEKGNQVFAALGGAAELTHDGAKSLQTIFGASLTEGLDARIMVKARHLEHLFKVFENRSAALYEVDPARELAEELGKVELPGFPAVLTPQDIAGLEVHFIGTYRQPASSTGSSAREIKDVPTRRFFNLFEVDVSSEILGRLQQHPAIRILSEQELSTTEHGTRAGKTSDNIKIADNLFTL